MSTPPHQEQKPQVTEPESPPRLDKAAPASAGAAVAAPPPARQPIPLANRKHPGYAPWAAIAGGAVLAAIILAATTFKLAPFLVLTTIFGGAALYLWSRSVEGPRHATDRGVTYAIAAMFALAVTPLISLLWTVVDRGLERFDGTFFTWSMRGVIGEGGGAIHAIYGTLIITGCAALISVPIGILTAIYLQEYGTGRLNRALTFFVDVMTGIPSIVAGLFAFSLFSLFFGPGIRLGIMGSVALSVLMIPIVVRS